MISNCYNNILLGANHTQYQLAEALWPIIDNTVSELNYQDCVVYLFDHKKRQLHQRAAHGPKRLEPNQIFEPLVIPVGKGVVGNVAKSRKPFIVPDTRCCSEYITDVEKGMSEIAVPIICNDQVIGVIDSESEHIDYYCSNDVSILTELASIIANTLATRFHQTNLQQLLDQSTSRTPNKISKNDFQASNQLKTPQSNQEILSQLTKTQIKILFELSKNKTSKQIADTLGMNYRTVQVHRQNICTRLRLKGPNALLHFASIMRITHKPFQI